MTANFALLHNYILREKEIISQMQNAKNTEPFVDRLRKFNENIAKILENTTLVASAISEDFPSEKTKQSQAHDLNDLSRISSVSFQNPAQIQEPTGQTQPIIQQQPAQFNSEQQKFQKQITANQYLKKTTEFERHTLKRLRKGGKRTKKKKIKKASKYVKVSNAIFSNISIKLSKKKMYRHLKRDLIKSNLAMLPVSYISVVFFTTLISFFVGLLAFTFFLFFNIVAEWPIINPIEGSLFNRFLMTFWIIFAVPIVTFTFMYFYPSMEKKSLERKIDQELPFAAIHMSAISGSMIEPSKIFSIIIATGEYPNLIREFTKLLNEINVYGYDLVTALRTTADNNPSKKLADLLNGMATTISSGGDLPEFFDKRAHGLLFEYRLEREKYTRTAETFMDIYISVVIAAPMIFMLLLLMIKVSGLGISLSTGMIALLMILGVIGINVIFLTFLHLKQPSG